MTFLALAVTAANRTLFGVVKWLAYVIAALMIYEVFARYSLSEPTSWAPELATLLFGPFFLLGGPYLLHLGGHVAVDLLSARATGRMAATLKIMGAVAAAIFAAILLRFSLPLAVQSWEYGETSYSGWNPIIWPAKAILPIASALLLAQALAEIVLAATRETARS